MAAEEVKMTRDEHLQWCKNRALEYLKPGQFYSPQEAVTSMLSDLNKHDETSIASDSVLTMMGLHAARSGDPNEARRFIEGFN